jgi:SAM-dependent methyltransferase
MMTAALDYLNRHGKTFSARLHHGVHPKHLVATPGHDWYLTYLRVGDHVLDLGCGNMVHTDRIMRAGHQTDWMDAAFGDDITQPLPYADGTFDVVTLLDVLEHLEPRQAVLAEIWRVLKPTGLLLVTGPNRMSRWRQALRAAGLFSYQDADHKIEYTYGEFIYELEQAGFIVEHVRPIVYDTPWAGLIDLIGGLSLTCYGFLARWKASYAHRYPSETTGWTAVAWKR